MYLICKPKQGTLLSQDLRILQNCYEGLFFFNAEKCLKVCVLGLRGQVDG